MMKRLLLKITVLSTIMVLFYTLTMFAVGWVNDGGGNWMYVDKDGYYLKETIKSSGDDKFYIDKDGLMVRDYVLEDYDGATYYFDDTGAMVKNTWVAVDPLQIENGMDNPPSVYLYYFGNNGKAYKAKSNIVKKVIDGKKYLFNENGQMLSGWINEEGERYSDIDFESDPFVGFCYFAGDETDGVLREGWTAYEEGSVEDKYYLKQTLWFYFGRNNNKKVCSENDNSFVEKKINNKTYAFDENGVMVAGWDTDTLDPRNEDTSYVTQKYYLEDDRDLGRLAKKEWVFAVPSMKQNLDDHDQEIERWFYSVGGGNLVKGIMRKVNSNYYVFNTEGIMKTGLCIIEKSTRRYVDCMDIEKTDGKDFIISRHYISVDKTSGSKPYEIFDDSIHSLYYFEESVDEGKTLGKMLVGEQTVSFGDADYLFASQKSGEYEGFRNKKYYQAGIKLQADSGLGLGLVFLGYSDSDEANTVDYPPIYNNSPHSFARPDKSHDNIITDYIVLKSADAILEGKYPVFSVLGTSGAKIAKSNTVKKDKSGRYWVIGKNSTLINIYEVPVRYGKSTTGTKTWQFKSEKTDTSGKVKTTWIDFGTVDEYGKTCSILRNAGDYVLEPDDSYCLNFRFED